MRITDRDLDVVESVGRLRFLTAEFIEWLYFPPQDGPRAHGFSSSCRRRLRLLWQAGYLDRIWPDRFHGPAVYTLNRQGARLLSAHRGIRRADLAPLGRGEPSTMFLEHTLNVARVYAAVRVALSAVEQVDVKAFHPEHVYRGPGCHDRLPDPAGGKERIPVVPDGLFVLQRAGDQHRLVFLEVDRGTMGLKRVAAKLRGYEAYRLGTGPRLFRKRFDFPPVFDVAWTAPDEGRLQSMQELAERELARWGWQARAARHLFHVLPALTPETALAWEDARRRPVSLLGGCEEISN